MVSPERLASLQMAGDVGAAVVNGHSPRIDATPLCGCGKPTSHRGMCSVRWAKRKTNFGSSGIKPKTFDINVALLDDRPRLMRLALSWERGDQSRADDLVSQATLKMLENQHQFEVGTNFQAWATTILKNTRLDGFRRQKDHVALTVETDGDEVERIDGALQTAPMQDSTIAAREMARSVVSLATPKQREALLRVGLDGQSMEETADGMGVPVGTVKSLLSRGRDNLDPERRAARVIPAISRQNADSLDFVLSKLREERDRITSAITALEQCRIIFTRGPS